MNYLVISTSLSPTSKSRTMGEALVSEVGNLGRNARLLDLRMNPLPFCDAYECYADPAVSHARALVGAADGIVLASPVYNYTVGAAAKNLIELTGKSWTDKVVAFLCAAGGPHSYMSIMGIANSLMLDFRAVVLPRFVYATSKAFSNGALVDDDVTQRIRVLAADLCRVTEALRSAPVEIGTPQSPIAPAVVAD